MVTKKFVLLRGFSSDDKEKLGEFEFSDFLSVYLFSKILADTGYSEYIGMNGITENNPWFYIQQYESFYRAKKMYCQKVDRTESNLVKNVNMTHEPHPHLKVVSIDIPDNVHSYSIKRDEYGNESVVFNTDRIYNL